MTTRETLLDQLDMTREQLLMALEYLPDEALLEPAIDDNWTAAGLLSVLTAWDAELVTGMMRLKQGKRPERLLAALADPDAYSAARYAENQGRDLDVIFDDFQHARLQLETWIEEFSDKALSSPDQYKALGGRPLRSLIGAATFQNEARYIPALRTFAERWNEEPQGDPPAIPLSGIEILKDSPNGHNEPDNT